MEIMDLAYLTLDDFRVEKGKKRLEYENIKSKSSRFIEPRIISAISTGLLVSFFRLPCVHVSVVLSNQLNKGI